MRRWESEKRAWGLLAAGVAAGCVMMAAALAQDAREPAAAVATVTLSDGSEVRAEILGFADGTFHLREAGGLEFERGEREVISIDFGEAGVASGGLASPPAPDEAVLLVLSAVEHRRFLRVMHWADRQVREDRAWMIPRVDGRITTKLGSEELTPAQRRDLMLGRVILHAALKRREEARELFEEVKKEYPGDEVIRKFGRDVWRLRPRRKREETHT